MIRRLLTAATLALAVTLAACGSGDTTSPKAAPSAAPATSAARNQVECVNIDRAYNAWDSPSRPEAAADFASINLGTFKMAMEAGEDFSKSVTGYDDQASKTLAVAVAEYNVEMAMANVELTLGDKVSAEQARKLEGAAAKVKSDYQSWRSAVC